MYRRAVFTIVYGSIFTFVVLHATMGVDKAKVAGALSPLAQTVPYPDQADAVEQAVWWLVTAHQNEDGGYSSFSQGADLAQSQVGGTIDAILAIAAAGYNPAAPHYENTNTPIGFLQANLDQVLDYAAGNGGQAGKLILALVATGQNPRDFVDIDLVDALVSQQAFSGQYGVEDPIGQALAIMALSAADEPVSDSAINWLVGQQVSEGELLGSWDDGYGTAGNADATAMSLMALASTGITLTSESQLLAFDFLVRTRLDGGGWEYGPGLGESVNSTALVIQALSGTDFDFYSESPNDISPLTALLSWQGESGAFQVDYGDGRFDDFFATVQAVPAAAGRGLPLPGRYQAALRAVDCLATIQDPDSAGWEQFATLGVSPIGTSRAIQAITAVGGDPSSARWTKGDFNAISSLEAAATDLLVTGTGGGLGALVQGVTAAGGDPHDFAGSDLTLAITQHLSTTGEYDNTAFGPFSHVEAMKGLLAAGEQPDPSSVEWLLGSHDGGDWGGADSTGIAISVLADLGISVPEALDELSSSQLSDGGWGFDLANPNSSSEVVQGLVAAGENPFIPSWSRVVSGTINNAADAILAQQGENGCWPNLFGPGDDPFATTDAVLLLTQQPSFGAFRKIVAAVPALIAESGDDTPEPDPTENPTAVPAETPVPEDTPTEEPAEENAPVPDQSEATMEAEVENESIDDAEPVEDNSSTIPIFAIVTAAIVLIGAGSWYIRTRN